jgi:formylglycine-generating enzyme required for sulfatase activity
MQASKPKNARRLAHLWSFFFPAYLFTAAAFDSSEVTNREYLKFVLSTRHGAPEYWSHGRFPASSENDPVVLVSFHDAMAYCRWIGKRLPSVDEWKSTCEGGKLKKRGDIWEWTSTDVDMGGQTYKALCGPANTCDCSHRYLPEWKNQVKGFRCVQDSTPVTWLRALFQEEVFL